MSLRRSRRRARRGSAAKPVLVLVTVVGLLLLVGGLSRVGTQSRQYDASSELTLASQGAVLAEESNATAAAVRDLMADFPAQTRQSLQAALDGAVQQSATQAARAAQVTGSMPAGSPAASLADVFAERARSVAAVRAALDGFLGMAPRPVAGAPAASAAAPGGTGAGRPGTSTLLSAEQAAGSIAAAGAALSRSDAQYRAVRAALAAGRGHARLPSSVWVTDPAAWKSGAVAAQVDLAATSPRLALSHDVVLRTVRLTPAALPPAPDAPAGVSVLSPTTTLGVTVVEANQGSASQASVSTRIELTDQASGATSTHVVTIPLALDATVVLPTVSFRVVPGSSYLLVVQVVLPAGQTLTLGTALEQALRVAPAT